MNIKQAKQIPIQTIVQFLGGKESTQKGDEIWYFSPFRPLEKTPSFKVNLKLNTWYDFGFGAGGSVIDLWIDFNKLDRRDGNSIKLALAGLKNCDHSSIEPNVQSNNLQQRADQIRIKDRFSLLKRPSKIWINSLMEELNRRCIPFEIAVKYLKQAYFKDNESNRIYNGLAFPNDKDGWEISVPNPQKETSFKTVIGQKAITTKYNQNARTTCIFEGFWDYLSFLALYPENGVEYNALILNSLSFIRFGALELISRKDEIDTVLLFLDNDTAGDAGTNLIAELLEPEGLRIGTMNHIYEGFKDLNDYLMKNRNTLAPK